MSATPITGHLTAAGSITGGPWTGTIYKEMDWVQRGNVIFLTPHRMIPQRIERTGAATWSRADFSYSVGPASAAGAAISQGGGILDHAAAVGADRIGHADLVGRGVRCGHVGQYIRYLSKAMLITAFTDTTHVTATVIETLPARRPDRDEHGRLCRRRGGRGRDLHAKGAQGSGHRPAVPRRRRHASDASSSSDRG
jgi:hypothetical protein